MEGARAFVRVFLTVLFAVAFVIGTFMGKLPWERLADVAGAMIFFWFGERAAMKRTTSTV
jgi:hypothetical protein